VVAIRQHDIQLSTQPPQISQNQISQNQSLQNQTLQNVVKATVIRQVFLGASRDYMVEASDGTVLRLVTTTDNAVAKGTEVWLTLPPERCRALQR
jgi:iron(III) transport system ATP-binding protein